MFHRQWLRGPFRSITLKTHDLSGYSGLARSDITIMVINSLNKHLSVLVPSRACYIFCFDSIGKLEINVGGECSAIFTSYSCEIRQYFFLSINSNAFYSNPRSLFQLCCLLWKPQPFCLGLWSCPSAVLGRCCLGPRHPREIREPFSLAVVPTLGWWSLWHFSRYFFLKKFIEL